jgi:hypothetical protein
VLGNPVEHVPWFYLCDLRVPRHMKGAATRPQCL